MGGCDTFNTVCNELAGYQRILHSLVAHGNSVTYTDCGKFNWSSACHAYAILYGLCDAVKLNVSRNDFILCAADTD